jgi:hypothetical protein
VARLDQSQVPETIQRAVSDFSESCPTVISAEVNSVETDSVAFDLGFRTSSYGEVEDLIDQLRDNIKRAIITAEESATVVTRETELVGRVQGPV